MNPLTPFGKPTIRAPGQRDYVSASIAHAVIEGERAVSKAHAQAELNMRKDAFVELLQSYSRKTKLS